MGDFSGPKRSHKPVPLVAVTPSTLVKIAAKFDARTRRWIAANGFEAKPGTSCLLPSVDGNLDRVLIGVRNGNDIYSLAALPLTLPAGNYEIGKEGLPLSPQYAALGWGLGSYQYTRYREPRRKAAQLLVGKTHQDKMQPLLKAVSTVRDLVNAPSEQLGPQELAAVVRELGVAHKASYREWVGDKLLKANFPAIHTVGRASHRAPRLVELNWGRKSDPQLVVVGKGVCFDSGGLDIKAADGMRWMKKDMGGAAHAIALAGLIMQSRLPVRLKLLIPAVENTIAENAYRPGDVIRTRAGITVEIDNTDAEGRLILCDALTYATECKPDLILDFATLTGASRIALGPDLPSLFSNRDDLAAQAFSISKLEQDPLWPMPLWQPYQAQLDSYIADLTNCGSRYAGAITAALYLQRFVPDSTPWCHVDLYAWNDTDRPGRPRGGEAQTLRTFFAFLQSRYPNA